MGYWTKFFADGATVYGDDNSIRLGIASWRNSRLDSMVGVDIECDGYLCRIQGAGEYWQSDQLAVSVGGGGPALRSKRRIQKRIAPFDTHFRVAIGPGAAKIVFNGGIMEGGKHFPVSRHMHNKWLILEFDTNTRIATHYIRDNKL